MDLHHDPLPPPGPPPVARGSLPCGGCRFAIAPRSATRVAHYDCEHQGQHHQILWPQVPRQNRVTPLVLCTLHDCIRFPMHYGCADHAWRPVQAPGAAA